MNPIYALQQAMTNAGQPLDRINADGRIHRYHPERKNSGNVPCWYRAQWFGDHLTATFGDWRSNSSHRWQSWEHDNERPVDFAAIVKEQAAHRRKAQKLKALNQAIATKKARALWKTLREEGTSAYLNRKQVPALRVRFGCDANGPFLAVPMRGPDGQLRGFQRIYDDGTKRFNKGVNKRGTYHLIGSIDQEKTLYVAEGYATAASVHTATGCPVVVCFDAGNISPVLDTLRKQHPRQPIFIAADNDQWKAEEPNQNGKPKGNTGICKAQKAARRYRAQVAIPDFSGLDTSSKPTDFNDLHRLIDLDAVRHQLKPAHAPTGNISETKPSHPTIQPVGGFRDPHHLHRIDAPFFDPDHIPNEGVVLLDGALGSGKTECIKSHATAVKQRCGRVLYISMLQSLCGQAAKRLDLEDYRDYKPDRDGWTMLQASNALAICLPSLHKLAAGPGYDIIILDEVSQIFAQLVSKLIRVNDRLLIFDTLMSLLRRAKLVICADGTMDSAVIPLLEAARPGERFIYVRNTHQPHRESVATWHDSEHDLLGSLEDCIEAGENLYITTDSRERAKQIHHQLSRRFPDLTGRTIHGENSQTAETQAILTDINSWIEGKCPRWLVCSPSVGTGVSIDVAYFDRVVGFFDGQDITAGMAYQQLRRVRHVPHLNIWARCVRRHLETDPDIIREEFIKTAETEAALVRIDWDTGVRCARDPHFETLWIAKKALGNQEKNDFSARLRGWMIKEGYTLETIPNAAKLGDQPGPEGFCKKAALLRIAQGKMLKQEARAAVQREYNEKVATADPMLCSSETEREKIRTAQIPTHDQRLAAIRFDVARFNAIPITAVTPDMVEEHKKYELPKKVRRAVAAGLPDAAVRMQAQKQLFDEYRFLIDVEMLVTYRALIRGILAYVGIRFDTDGTIRWSGATWTEGQLRESRLAEYLHDHAAQIHWVKGLPNLPRTLAGEVPVHPPSNKYINSGGGPTSLLCSYVGSVLNTLGLPTCHSRPTRNGQRVREYRLDEDRLQRINQLAASERRQLDAQFISPEPCP